MLSKSLIQFSTDGWGCVPSLCLGLKPHYGGGNGGDGNSLQKNLYSTPKASVVSAPDLAAGHWRPMPPAETLEHSQANLTQSLVGSLLLSPGPWCTRGFVCAFQESVSPVGCKFCHQIPLAFKVRFPGGSQSLCQILWLGSLFWALELLQ